MKYNVPLANTLTTMLFLSTQQKLLNRLWNEAHAYFTWQ